MPQPYELSILLIQTIPLKYVETFLLPRLVLMVGSSVIVCAAAATNPYATRTGRLVPFLHHN